MQVLRLFPANVKPELLPEPKQERSSLVYLRKVRGRSLFSSLLRFPGIWIKDCRAWRFLITSLVEEILQVPGPHHKLPLGWADSRLLFLSLSFGLIPSQLIGSELRATKLMKCALIWCGMFDKNSHGINLLKIPSWEIGPPSFQESFTFFEASGCTMESVKVRFAASVFQQM